MYFGNKNRMIDVPCPAINIDRGTGRWESSGTYLNGGAYQISSGYAHRRYGVSWNLMSADSIRRITDYYYNVFGDGLIYMIDPFIEKRNTLPLNWSVPVLGLFDAPTLVYDTLPSRAQASVPSYINRFTNPSFETTSGTVEVRRNPIANPGPRSASLTGWAGQVGTGEAVTTSWVNTPGAGPEGRTGFYRRTVTAPKTSGTTGSFYRSAAGEVTGTTGDVRTFSIWVKFPLSTAGVTLSASYRLGATSVNGLASAQVTVAANTWTRLSVTVTATGTYDGVQLWATHPYFTSSVIPIGGAYDAADALAELGADLRPYFDAQSPSPDPDLVASAVGTAYASASILNAQRLVADNITGGGLVAASSTQWAASGTKSLRQIPNTSSNNTWTAFRYNLWPAITAGKTYTVLATMRLAAPQTGTLHSLARTIRALYDVGGGSTYAQSATAPNTAGTHELRLTFTIPPGTLTNGYIYFHNGASQGGGDVWWDDVLLVEGNYTGPYFDGNTPNTPSNAYTWSGPANASTTVLTAYPTEQSGLPREAAQYTITESSTPVEVFIPVPPGKVLHFGALGSKTGTAGVQLVSQTGTVTNVVLLPMNSSQMTNTTVTESVTLRLSGVGTITLQALTARILAPGEVSDYVSIFIPGEGNSGLRFTGVPAVSGYSSVMDKQALSVSLVETGAWEPQ